MDIFLQSIHGNTVCDIIKKEKEKDSTTEVVAELDLPLHGNPMELVGQLMSTLSEWRALLSIREQGEENKLFFSSGKKDVWILRCNGAIKGRHGDTNHHRTPLPSICKRCFWQSALGNYPKVFWVLAFHIVRERIVTPTTIKTIKEEEEEEKISWSRWIFTVTLAKLINMSDSWPIWQRMFFLK